METSVNTGDMHTIKCLSQGSFFNKTRDNSTYNKAKRGLVKTPVYLDVGTEPGVDPVRSKHIRQRGGTGEGGGYSVAHFRQREHLKAKLLIQLLQFFIGLLFTLTQDTAHHIPTLVSWPLRVHTEKWKKEKPVLIYTTVKQT